jgi:hypothetical protein
MMGLFDFFTRGGKDVPPPPEAPKYLDKKVASLAKRVADKKLQPFDRDEAIRNMIAIGTHEAATALLKRFSLSVDPSITDQEEKQLSFEAIVSIGKGQRGKRVADAGKDDKEISSDPLTPVEVAELRDAIIDATVDYCDKAENLTMPLKVMRELLDDAAYEAQLLAQLGRFDTEYTRNVEPKINVLAALESIQSDTILDAVLAYLDDVNETVRYHAVQTTFAQNEGRADDDDGCARSLAALVSMVENEESVRIMNKVCDGIMDKGWAIPADLRAAWDEGTRDVYEYRTDSAGRVNKV